MTLHLFYTDTWNEFLVYLKRIPEPFDLYVSLASADDLDTALQPVTAEFPDARLYVHPNRGRDVGPFLTLLNAHALEGYDAVLKLHSKSSLYSEHGGHWRHELLERLLPSTAGIASILDALRQHHPGATGLVGPEAFLLTEGRYWQGCAQRIHDMCKTLEIPAELQNVEFFAGTMFWFRPQALSRLGNVGLQLAHFEAEAGQRNATLAHVLERIFTLLCRASGFGVADSSNPDSVFEFRQYRRAPANILRTLLGENRSQETRSLAQDKLEKPTTADGALRIQRAIILIDTPNFKHLDKLAPYLKKLPLDARLVLVSETQPTQATLTLLQNCGHPLTAVLRRNGQPLLHASTLALQALEICPSDLLVRISLGFDPDDRGALQRFLAFLQAFLEAETLQGIVSGIEQNASLGIVLPASAPVANLWAANDGNFVDELAQRLSLPLTHFDKANFYPDGIYALTGSFLSQLLHTYLLPAQNNNDTALSLAVELGLSAIAEASGLLAIEARASQTVRGSSDALSRYVGQLLKTPLDDVQAPQFREREYHEARSDQPVKVIAYYLPQFHPVPENDRWWGPGFTEWHNVAKAVPRFIGHYQPHLPSDLGFYDLRLPEVMHRQVDLARSHGIHGFCFYYYWFNGKRLLETPIENYHADPGLSLPYCLCWANENWTRRWDGQDQEILMEQAHSARDDIRFIESIAKHLADTRYIRVNGRPMLIVYRPNQLADARATTERWRKYCRDNGIGEIHLVAVRSFGVMDPEPFGFDAAVEFPPHGLNQAPITSRQEMVDPDFSGIVYDYRDSVMHVATTKYVDAAKASYPVIEGCMLSWDNDARRRGSGHVFHHASPQSYANWLRLAAQHGKEQDEAPFVFVNAWNEWAEGTHLEPDRRYGHAYLTATADTVALFQPHDGLMRSDAPAGLGFASPLLRILPRHLLQRRGATELALYRKRFQALGITPSLHIILAVREASIELLDTLYTLAEQSYTRLRLSLVSADPVPLEWGRPITTELIQSTDLVAGMNRAAQASDADWLMFLEQGDQLFPHSLLEFAMQAAAHPDAKVLFSDECVTDASSGTHRLVLKSTFDLVRLTEQSCIGGLLAVRRDEFLAVQGFTSAFNGLEQYDLLLRLAEQETTEKTIRHIPEVLLWRHSLPETRAGNIERQLNVESEIRAAHTHRKASGNTNAQLVSIIIPTHEQPLALQRCVESLFEHANQTPFELVIVDHANRSEAARAFIDGLKLIAPDRIRVIANDIPFNIAELNNRGAEQAHGDWLLFLNDDTASLHAGWLDAMLEQTQRPDTGIVGSRLVFPDGRLQHVGVMLGLSGAADMPWVGSPIEHPGIGNELLAARTVCAVTGACMLVSRSLFEKLGGFDTHYSIAYADFDLCLRARQHGLGTVVTPHSTLMHEAGLTLRAQRSDEDNQRFQQAFSAEQRTFLQTWRTALAHDPHHPSAVSLNSRALQVVSEAALAPDPMANWEGLPSVLGLPADQGGSGAYRITQPLRTAHQHGLARSRHATGYPSPLILERLGINTLVTQRQVDDPQLAALAALKASAPTRIVMDFDDALLSMPSSNFHKKNLWPDIERRIALACQFSDVITVSTAPLAEEMQRFHGDVRVITNGIDPQLWPTAPECAPSMSHKLRVGWAGGVSHAGDLAQIRAVVSALADEVEWVFFGMCLEDMRPHLTEFHRGVSFADYPRKLAELGLDLAIAPLELNRFNECKSNLRLLEYGALGIPTIATDIEPYRCGLPVTLVDNRPESWIRAIRDRIGERDALQAEGLHLRNAVLEDWTQERMLPAWLGAWKN